MNVTNGSQIIIGIPWSDIHFWRFWQLENGNINEKIIIVNDKKEAVNISFMIDKIRDSLNQVWVVTEKSFGTVGGPWEISANGYQIVSMPKLPDSIKENGKYLYEVHCNNSVETGLMKVSDAKPNGNFPLNRIITTTEVNGGPSSGGNYWYEHSSPFVTSGDKIIVRFTFIPAKFDPKVKDNECFIKIMDPNDSTTKRPKIPPKLIKVESGNLPIESKIESPTDPYRWRSLTINFPPLNEGSEYKGTYSVDFIFEAPTTITPEFQNVMSCIKRSGYTQCISIPFVVLPKGK
jgi:hypothetical protein